MFEHLKMKAVANRRAFLTGGAGVAAATVSSSFANAQ
jgi:hypothetical protein